MNNTLRIVFDGQTLFDCKVDVKIYQDRLIAAIPNYKLEFSFAKSDPDTLGMPLALSIVGGENVSVVFDAAKRIWPEVCGTAVQQPPKEASEGESAIETGA